MTKIYHPQRKHPPEYQQDLNPDANVGQNHGEAPEEGKSQERSALEIKQLHNRLKGVSNDELRRIPVLRRGTRLEAGATYIDLHLEPATECQRRHGGSRRQLAGTQEPRRLPALEPAVWRDQPRKARRGC